MTTKELYFAFDQTAFLLQLVGSTDLAVRAAAAKELQAHCSRYNLANPLVLAPPAPARLAAPATLPPPRSTAPAARRPAPVAMRRQAPLSPARRRSATGPVIFYSRGGVA